MGESEEDAIGAKPLRQPKKDGSQKRIRQAGNEISVFSSGEVEERGFTARKCRCAESDYRRRF